MYYSSHYHPFARFFHWTEERLEWSLPSHQSLFDDEILLLYHNFEVHFVNETKVSHLFIQLAQCSPSHFAYRWTCGSVNLMLDIFFSHFAGACTCSWFHQVCRHFPLHYLRLQMYCVILRRPKRIHIQLGLSTSTHREQQYVNSTERCKQRLQVQTHRNVHIIENIGYFYLRWSR